MNICYIELLNFSDYSKYIVSIVISIVITNNYE